MTKQGETRVESLDAEAITRIVGQLGHEVGTPLGSILLMAEMLGTQLEDLGADERQVARAGDLRRAAADIRAVVQGVVRLLRLRTGWIGPQGGGVDVAHYVESLAEAAEGDDRWHLQAASDLPPRIDSDPGFVREIVDHLLAWHGERGREGRLEVHAHDGGLAWRLHSEGPDVPWDVEAVLHPLEAGDLPASRQYGGRGLDLALAHALAWRLGGHLEGRSEEGRTLVTVRIPGTVEDPLG